MQPGTLLYDHQLSFCTFNTDRIRYFTLAQVHVGLAPKASLEIEVVQLSGDLSGQAAQTPSAGWDGRAF